MTLAIPDTRIMLPGLLVPGVIPMGTKQLNRSHQLARRLLHFVCIDRSHAVDLVTGQYTDTFVPDVSADGGVGAYAEHGGTGYRVGKIALPSTCTIIGRHYYSAGELHDHALFSKRSSTGSEQDLLLWLDYLQSELHTAAYAGSMQAELVHLAADTWHTWGAGLVAGTSTQFYLDGEAWGSLSGSPGSWDSTPCDWFIGANGDNTKSTVGGSSFVAVFDGLLSDDDHLEFSDNPGALILPANESHPIIPAGSSTTPVSNDLTLQWNALGRVTQDNDLRWQIYATIQNDLALAYDMLIEVTQDEQLAWQVLADVTNSTQIRWDLLALITNDVSLQWQILQAVQNNMQLAWQLLMQTTNDIGLAWQILQALNNDLGLAWDVRVGVNQALNVRWDLQSALTAVANDLGLAWNIDSALTPVSNDLALHYDIRHQIVQALDARWNLLQQVGVDLDMRWSIATAVAADLALSWDQRQQVTTSKDLRWDSIEVVNNSISFYWTLDGLALTPTSIIRIPTECRVIPISAERRVIPVRVRR